MDLVAIEDFEHEGESYRRGVTYVVPDEAGYRAHPERFAESTSDAGRAAQKDRVRSLARDPRNCEPADPTQDPRTRSQERRDGPPSFASRAVQTTRDEALRSIYDRAGEIDATSGDRLVALVEADRAGIDSEYVSAVADPAYERAFARSITNPVPGAAGMLSAEEHRAMVRVGRSMEMRALGVSEGATGGFAVPLTLDPTIMLTSNGAINPIRELATVRPILTTTWKGVNSEGVAFEFVAEAAEAKDKAPTLTQPEITPNRAQCWVPFSYETAEDWAGLSEELRRLFADAKDQKEAEVFATGKGSENIPQGLITGAEKVVETAAKEAVAIADVYSLQAALASRWQPRATWLGTNAVANQVYRFVAAGDTDEPPIMPEDRSSILGKPYREVSTMSSKTTTAGEKVLAYGDIASAYRIVDRIGLTVVPVPVVFGENRRPTGQAGLYAYFRVGAKVTVPSALQVLKVKA
ncbi:MAG TPA: phage major capsid protein [Solirubrobacterales bacterium]|nr:phage major capsid protein [Solirubrobacterales bacterium]